MTKRPMTKRGSPFKIIFTPEYGAFIMVNVFANEPENLPETPRLPLPDLEVGRVPLVQLKDGTVRFVGTRVSFDSIIFAHKQGRNPTQINHSFDLISVPDIEKAIEYYESEREIVDQYMTVRERIADAWRELSEARGQSPQWQAHLKELQAERKQPV